MYQKISPILLAHNNLSYANFQYRSYTIIQLDQLRTAISISPHSVACCHTHASSSLGVVLQTGIQCHGCHDHLVLSRLWRKSRYHPRSRKKKEARRNTAYVMTSTGGRKKKKAVEGILLERRNHGIGELRVKPT